MTLNFQGEKVGEKDHKLNINVIYGAKKKEPRGEKCDKCQQTSINPLNGFSNGRTGEHFAVCDDCYKCSQCKQKNIETIANEQSEKWVAGTWLCQECHDNKPGNKNQKENPNSDASLENEDIYCEKCDKWLDNPTDYTKIGGWKVKCNSCQSTIEVVKGEKENETGYYPLNVYILTNTYCYVCGRKNCWSEEGIKRWEEDNKHKKPNWKKRKKERMAIQHDWKDWELILRHDCYLNCPSGEGGCGKKFKLTQKSAPLFQWRHLEFFPDERCASCRLKEFKDLIAKAKQKGQELNKEGKEYLKELEEMVAEENGGSSTAPTSPSSPPTSSTPTTSTSKLVKKKKRLTTEITILETVPNKTPIQETHLTNKKQELKGVEELETIIKYFLENKVKKITMEGEKLVIEYSNGSKKTVATDTNQLKTIWDRMKKVNKKSLLASELGIDIKAKNNPLSNNPSNQPNTDKKWWWIGGGVIVLLVIGGVVYLLKKGRRGKKKV